MAEERAVSVLIATFRSPDSLERVLHSVLGQLDAGDEVIVVDDGSGDDTAERLARIDDPRLTVLVQDNRGVSAARNRAAAAARSPLLVFLDDDEIPAPGWLAAHRAAHRGATHQVAMGCAELVVPAGRGSRALPVEPPAATGEPTLLVNDSFSVPRADFEHVGGFDPRLVHGGEDIDLGLRLVAQGSTLVHAAGAVIRHEIDRTYREFRRQRLRRGHASLVLEAEHGVRLVALPADVPRRDRPFMVIAERSRLVTEVVCALLWGVVRAAGLASAWRVQAAAAGRITLMLGLVGRNRARSAPARRSARALP